MSTQWTQEQLNNATTFGVCLVCMTPQEMRKTVTEKNGHTNTHYELVRPCGHTEHQIDAKLGEML